MRSDNRPASEPAAYAVPAAYVAGRVVAAVNNIITTKIQSDAQVQIAQATGHATTTPTAGGSST